MLIPWQVNVLYPRWPISNLAIVGSCIGIWILCILRVIPDNLIEAMVLQGWNPIGLVGHMFLHADILHLAFNMLFLWIFGNAVCSKWGNLPYLTAFLAFGISAAAIYNGMDGREMVGASGAINGVVGFYLALYPLNHVTCFYLFFFKTGTFDISGLWIIGFWLLGDIWGVYHGKGDIAYWAHLGGFGAGLTLGLLALKLGWIKMTDLDHSTLLELVFKQKPVLETDDEDQDAPVHSAPQPFPPEPLYYIYSNDQQMGPYSKKTIRQLLDMQQIMPSDLIYDNTTQQWVLLQHFLSSAIE